MSEHRHAYTNPATTPEGVVATIQAVQCDGGGIGIIRTDWGVWYAHARYLAEALGNAYGEPEAAVGQRARFWAESWGGLAGFDPDPDALDEEKNDN